MEDELREIALRFWKSADVVYKRRDYTSATILYFKCFFVMLDCIIFRKLRKTPKDHTERFRILETDFPGLYEILDKYYPLYRDTYSITIEKDSCDEVRENVAKIKREHGFEIENQKPA